MKKVESGSHVKLCYKGRLEEVENFGEEEKCQEVELNVGAGEVLKGFEEAIIGMVQNERRTFVLGPEEAYGERDDRLERTLARAELPPDFDASAGEMIALQTDRGDQILAMVKDSNSDTVTLDLNHPLAGKSLVFEVEIEDVQ